MKFKVLKLRDGIQYIMMTLFLICSGSVIGSAYAKYFDVIYSIVCVGICCLYIKKMNKNNIILLSVFLLLYGINAFFNKQSNPNYNAYFSYMLRMMGTMFLCSSFNRKDFEQKYIKLLTVLSAIGLVVFIGVYAFNVTSFTLVDNYLMFGPFNFVKHHEKRNSCIFWEPGAYQLFIVYALFLIAEKEDWKSSNLFKRLDFIILIISLISTQSTTGYVCGCLLFAYFVFKNWNRMKRRNKVFIIIPIILLVGVAFWRVYLTDVIRGKLSMSNASYVIRMNDLRISLELLFSKVPLLGYGLETDTIRKLYSMGGINNNSVGILTESITMGLVFTLLYTTLIFKRIKNRYPRRMVIVLIFIISMLTEDFYYFPIYHIFVFGFRDEFLQNHENLGEVVL